jgi:hypothetical protein
MKDCDIKKGMYVRVDGHVGVVGKTNPQGFCGDGVGYRVDFLSYDTGSMVVWWCTADELEQVHGI